MSDKIKTNIISAKDFLQEKDKILQKNDRKKSIISLIDNEGASSATFNKIADSSFIEDLKGFNDFQPKTGGSVISNYFYNSSVMQLGLLAIDDKKTADKFLKIAGDIFKLSAKNNEVYVMTDLPNLALTKQNLVDLLVGFELAEYRFDKYFVAKAKDKKQSKITELTIVTHDDMVVNVDELITQAQAVASSVILARNLVNEPANQLNTEQFKNKIKQLEEVGLEIEILDCEQLKKHKMNALLGVAQGSVNPPFVAIMRWYGAVNRDEQPAVFVGKGVVFDSGGISLKPGSGMEDMKGDMGGAAAVVGALQLVALSKAKMNVVGIVGLVENMPDAGAQRPGDVVTSMSGQTIEIINTDAEGRLVLADILHYAKENFSPKFMVNLATLTGAILVALGQEYAGLFSNNEELTEQLLQASKNTAENLWHMPLSANYDKMVDSKVADMRNSAGRYAGSITAAQFLQRFVGDVAWAHLDIAGTAFGAPKTSYCQSWASGFGVRLLNQLVTQYSETVR